MSILNRIVKALKGTAKSTKTTTTIDLTIAEYDLDVNSSKETVASALRGACIEASLELKRLIGSLATQASHNLGLEIGSETDDGHTANTYNIDLLNAILLNDAVKTIIKNDVNSCYEA